MSRATGHAFLARDAGRRVRKPQFSFGWDWALPLPSIGILGHVRLEEAGVPALLDVCFQPFNSGRLDCKFKVNPAAREAGYELRVRVQGHGQDVQKIVRRADKVCNQYTTLQLSKPKLWWPEGLGNPALYDWVVQLMVNGEVRESRSGRLGFREVKILEEPFTEEAGAGISFWLQVNGVRAFCKGANWVPLDHWPARVKDEEYDFYVRQAAEANFGMLRVWGGGLYERERFYDRCDELGLMVWQDFMFASGTYYTDLLRDEIIAEAEHQIKRLRNRPCIVLWCGINEDIYSWLLPEDRVKKFGLPEEVVYEHGARKFIAPKDATPEAVQACQPAFGLPPVAPAVLQAALQKHGLAELQTVDRLHEDPQIYSMILRGLVGKWGQGVPYIESSPQSHDDYGNMLNSGNCHISSLSYAREPGMQRFREFFDKACSFNSEFAACGPAGLETMKKILTPAHLWPPDDVWAYHFIGMHRMILNMAQALFGPVDSLEQYVKYGQALHAELWRAEMEHARRNYPNNGGTLHWMYNDCWPTGTWTTIDYYHRLNPAYYASKRACAPRLPIIFERAGQVEFFLSNHTAAALHGQMTIGQERLDGERVWSASFTADAKAAAAVKFHARPRSELDLRSGDYLFIDAEIAGRPLPRVTYFPGLWRDVVWPAPKIALSIARRKKTGNEWLTRLKVSTDVYARFLHLIIPARFEAALDDNFFDLSAGQTREILVRSKEKITAADVGTGHWGTVWP